MDVDPDDGAAEASKELYCLFNPLSGEYLYTVDEKRSDNEINDSLAVFSNGIGECGKRGGAIWKFDRLEGYWRLTITSNLAAYQWDAVKQVLHYLDPNGDALYDVIYTDFYTGSDVIQEWDSWWPVRSSMIYSDSNASGCVLYYFK